MKHIFTSERLSKIFYKLIFLFLFFSWHGKLANFMAGQWPCMCFLFSRISIIREQITADFFCHCPWCPLQFTVFLIHRASPYAMMFRTFRACPMMVVCPWFSSPIHSSALCWCYSAAAPTTILPAHILNHDL